MHTWSEYQKHGAHIIEAIESCDVVLLEGKAQENSTPYFDEIAKIARSRGKEVHFVDDQNSINEGISA